MAELNLWFAKSEIESYELEKTFFTGNLNVPEIIAVRGKTAGAYKGAGTFQWTPGVKALVIIFLVALARHLKGTKTFLPLLEGEKGSLAASLDYALNKQPEWLFDMFGADEKSNAYLRQLLLRSNTGRRRKGPVSISLNEQILSPQSIKVYVGDVLIQDVQTLQHMAATIINSENGQALGERNESNRSNGSNGSYNNGEVGKSIGNTGAPSLLMSASEGKFPVIIPVSETDIEDIYKFEQEHFPSSHATIQRLLGWLRHDPNNYMCIKEPGQPFLAYYLIMFLKPEWMQKYLTGELIEVDIKPEHLLEASSEVYAEQDNVHITVFASRTHASVFTFDLLWHLIGRLLDLAVNGRLSTIYAEIATNDGKILVEKFGFQLIRQTSSGGLLYRLEPSVAMLREWEWRYKQRTFCKIPKNELQARIL
jgi:hypothetical protein